MNYYVYAIISHKDNRMYVGMSHDPERRLHEHNSGRVFSTKGFRPWVLVFFEDCGADRVRARQREKYWKSGSGKEKLKSKYSGVVEMRLAFQRCRPDEAGEKVHRYLFSGRAKIQ